jgi:hypothetical protein
MCYYACTYPERTSQKGYHATSETRLLALGCYSFVNTVSQPNVGVNIPAVKEDLEVRMELNVHDVQVSGTVPSRFSGRSVAVESVSSENTGTLYNII